MVKRVAGGFMLAFGTLLGGFIVYGLFTGERGNGRPIPAIAFVSGLLYVGGAWIKGETAE